MRKLIAGIILAVAIAHFFSSVAHGYSPWEAAADLATGGAYSATKATVDTGEELLKEIQALDGEIESLIASIEKLGQRIQDTVAQFANLATNIAQQHIVSVRALPDQIGKSIERKRSQLERDTVAYERLANQLIKATAGEAARVRNEMRQFGQRVWNGSSKEDGKHGFLPIATISVADPMRGCNLPESHQGPKKTLALLKRAAVRMQEMHSAISATLAQPIVDSANFAGSNLDSSVNRLEAATILSVESVKNSINFSLPGFRSQHETLARLLLEPWNAASYALDPIRDSVNTAQRAVDEFERELETNSQRLQDEVLRTTSDMLSRSEEQMYTVREYDRLSRDMHEAAIRAMACGDPASVTGLVQATSAVPRPRKTKPQNLYTALPTMNQPAQAVMRKSPVLLAIERTRNKTDRIVSVQRRAAPQLQQAYQQIAPKEAEFNRHVDALFRNKSPQEIQNNRAQILNMIGVKLGAYPHLMKAAEGRLDVLIKARTAGIGVPRDYPARSTLPVRR